MRLDFATTSDSESRPWIDCTDVLCSLAKALGYTCEKPGTDTVGMIWHVPGGRTVSFARRDTALQIVTQREDGLKAVWGEVSPPVLAGQIEKWVRNNPERAAEVRTAITALKVPSYSGAISDHSEKSLPEIADRSLAVLANRQICDRHFLMDVEVPCGVPNTPQPGQFFQVVCDPDADGGYAPPLTLRRPLSIHRVTYDGFPRLALANTADIPDEIRAVLLRHPIALSFLYRLVGEGTRKLSLLKPGAQISALGPLGNGFHIGTERTAVIVSGGIGVAPLAALAEELRFAGKEVRVFLGAVRGEMLSLTVSQRRKVEHADPVFDSVIRSEFHEIGVEVLGICTDDGSIGAKGLVTDLLEQGIRDGCVPADDICVYACGPRGMMQAVAGIATRHGLPCQVSLEERMACGVGACYSCTCDIAGSDGRVQKKRVCREGPVFSAKDILWKG